MRDTYNAVKDYVNEQGATLLRWGWGHVSNDYPMQFRVVYPPESYTDIFFQQAKNVYPDISTVGHDRPGLRRVPVREFGLHRRSPLSTALKS